MWSSLNSDNMFLSNQPELLSFPNNPFPNQVSNMTGFQLLNKLFQGYNFPAVIRLANMKI